MGPDVLAIEGYGTAIDLWLHGNFQA